MNHTRIVPPPDLDEAPAPLVEELPPSLEPWDACRRLAHLPHLLFLDNALQCESIGRYSFVTADPFALVTSRRGRFKWRNFGRITFRATDEDPFVHLASGLSTWATRPVPGLPPFQGGAAGLFGYDLCHHLERLPRPRFDEFAAPDLCVGVYDWVVAFDHRRGRSYLFSTGQPEWVPTPRLRRALERLRYVRKLLRRSAPVPPAAPRLNRNKVSAECLFPLPPFAGVFSNFTAAGYVSAVRRAIEYVHAGDCYQVNLSQRLLHAATIPPLELYGRLRERNAAPFAGYFDLGDFVIASASPERFLRVEDDEVETRPIKGTRPRGSTPEEDRRRAEELLRSSKDRAENVMIIDLLRNDLGRVCAYGSVRVPHVCRLESYRYVHHLVSEVRGQLREGLGAIDLLRAAFPGGSVTGAPKIRAMEIIAELEPTARGPYCGSLGYVGFDGTMDTNLLIRTFTVGKGWVQFPVGGGVVADSDPEAEYAETLHKAEGLLRALRD